MADRLMAEFGTKEDLAAAIGALAERGYRRLNAYTPFQVPEVDRALNLRRSRLPYAVFVVGMCAAGGAYFLQWFLVAFLYPLNVGGRPPHFPLAFLLITFEMGVLFAGFASFFGVLILGRLLRLVDVPQSTEGFGSVTQDRFWLEVSQADPRFDPDRTPSELYDLGALRVEFPRIES